jgi:DNA-directed RNA polymerase specialized sigma24 family protein
MKEAKVAQHKRSLESHLIGGGRTGPPSIGPKTLGEFSRDTWNRCLKLAFYLTTVDDAKDMASEITERILDRLRDEPAFVLGDESQQEANLYLAVDHKDVDRGRHKTVQKGHAEDVRLEMDLNRSSYGQPEMEFHERQVRHLVERAMGSLEQIEQDCWFLEHEKGLSERQIGIELGLAKSAVTRLKARTRRSIQRHIERFLTERRGDTVT